MTCLDDGSWHVPSAWPVCLECKIIKVGKQKVDKWYLQTRTALSPPHATPLAPGNGPRTISTAHRSCTHAGLMDSFRLKMVSFIQSWLQSAYGTRLGLLNNLICVKVLCQSHEEFYTTVFSHSLFSDANTTQIIRHGYWTGSFFFRLFLLTILLHMYILKC